MVELKESSWCCGSAGIYALSQPGQADLLLGRKVSHVLETGASVVATGNPGCQMQIARGCAMRPGLEHHRRASDLADGRGVSPGVRRRGLNRFTEDVES